MTWFFIALIGPFLYAVANHTDKYLISKYFKGGQIGALIIFSSIFSLLALPIILLANPEIFNISVWRGLVLAVNGSLVVISILFYLYALQKEETSLVVPFYQTIPIFAFILGYYILGETLTLWQGVAFLIILAGALVLSFELGVKQIRFKTKIVLLMLGASFLYALNGVVFKLIAIEDGFWTSTFWSLVGKIILGFIFLSFVPSYRKHFFSVIKDNQAKVLGLNSLNETAVIVADAVTAFATLLAPVALVFLINAFQPFFVLLLGIILTIFLPQFSRESLLGKHLVQKIVGIGLILVGTLCLSIA